MTKYKVSELEGALLDAAVAICMGYTKRDDCGNYHRDPVKIHGKLVPCCVWPGDNHDESGYPHPYRFHPSGDWSQGGPIIEANQIFLTPPSTEHHNGGSTPGWNNYTYWRATVSLNTRSWFKPGDEDSPLAKRGHVGRGTGPTPLIAAMRAVVASYGYEEIELP